MALTYRVPWASSALSAEGVGHPRVLVGPVPNGDADASLDVLARRDDGLVVLLLLRKQGSRRREGHADIELGDGDLDAKSGERLEVGLERGGDLADDEVALEADTIDGSVCGLERLDEVEHGGGLGALLLDVVVVDVELGSGIGGACGLQGSRDVGGAESVVEDIAAPGTIIVEGL